MSDYLDSANQELLADSQGQIRIQADALDAGLGVLGTGVPEGEAMDEIYRAAHSLKSEASVLGMDALADLAQVVQDIAGEARAGRLSLAGGMIQRLRAAAGQIRRCVSARAQGSKSAEEEAARGLAASREALLAIARDAAQEAARAPEAAPSAKGGKEPRVAVVSVGARRVMEAAASTQEASRAAAELLSMAESARASLADLENLGHRHAQAAERLAARLPASFAAVQRGGSLADSMKDITDTMEPLQESLAEYTRRIADSLDELGALARTSAKKAGDARESVSRITMVTFAQVAARLDRYARSLLRSRKSQALRVAAEDLELDGAVAAGLSRLLALCAKFLLRLRGGAAAGPRVILKARSEPDGVFVEIAGSGKLPKAAFAGREVRRIEKAAEKAGAKVRMDSRKGKGARFAFQLARVPGLLRCLLMKQEGRVYAIPASMVKECGILSRSAIREAGGAEVFQHSGRKLPVLHLADLVGLPSNGKWKKRSLAILAGKRGQFALLAEEALGMEDVAVARGPAGLKNMLPAGVTGGVVAADGSPTLILDPSMLVKIPRAAASGARRRAAKAKR